MNHKTSFDPRMESAIAQFYVQSDAQSPHREYRACGNLNLYDSSACERLATQAAIGRHLRLELGREAIAPHTTAIPVRLCEDDYPGWLSRTDWDSLQPAPDSYQAPVVSFAEIQAKLPQAIAFAQAAAQQPNEYLWGGTIGPDYDCSGLMQAAFASVGIWLPRDAYQQEAFTQPIAQTDLQPGDLVFFGTPVKATHVALYLGDLAYIHSSGKAQGRNGIGIDMLSDQGDAVSQAYYRQLRGFGRIVSSYQPSAIAPV